MLPTLRIEEHTVNEKNRATHDENFGAAFERHTRLRHSNESEKLRLSGVRLISPSVILPHSREVQQRSLMRKHNSFLSEFIFFRLRKKSARRQMPRPNKNAIAR